jgi:hypothetical protein
MGMSTFLANGCTSENGHCWHEHGVSMTTLVYGPNQGVDQMTCCNCGRPGERRWRDVTDVLPGHGPHVATSFRRYEPVTTFDQRTR